MESPPRNFDSFPKRISVDTPSKPTRISIFSILFSLFLVIFHLDCKPSNWDLNYLGMTSNWQIWRLFTCLFISKNGVELVVTILLLFGYIGCGAEVRKGSVRIIWEIILLGTTLKISKNINAFYNKSVFLII